MKSNNLKNLSNPFLLVLFLTSTQATMASENEIIDFKKTVKTNHRMECLESVMPIPPLLNQDEAGKFVVVGILDLLDSNRSVIKSINMYNGWMWDVEGYSTLEKCQANLVQTCYSRTDMDFVHCIPGIHEPSADPHVTTSTGPRPVVSRSYAQEDIFLEFYKTRNTVWKNAKTQDCYYKTLEIKNRPLNYSYHPVTGEQPKGLHKTLIPTSCLGDGADTIDPDTVSVTQVPIIKIQTGQYQSANKCTINVSLDSEKKIIYVEAEKSKSCEDSQFYGGVFSLDRENRYSKSQGVGNVVLKVISESSLTIKGAVFIKL